MKKRTIKWSWCFTLRGRAYLRISTLQNYFDFSIRKFIKAQSKLYVFVISCFEIMLKPTFYTLFTAPKKIKLAYMKMPAGLIPTRFVTSIKTANLGTFKERGNVSCLSSFLVNSQYGFSIQYPLIEIFPKAIEFFFKYCNTSAATTFFDKKGEYVFFHFVLNIREPLNCSGLSRICYAVCVWNFTGNALVVRIRVH